MDLMNFAKGGATFDNSVVQGQGKAGLTLEDVKTQIQMAVNSSIRLAEKDVVALWAGANDVMLSTMAGAQISSERLLALMESSLQSILFGLHPKTILVADHFAYELMPDKTLGNSLLPQFGFDFTDKLSHRLKELSTAYPETRFILLNARTITLDIHKCPSKYGFDPALLGTPCLPYYATKDTASLGLCGDVDGHVFFDEYHPTTRVHNLLADKAASLLVG
jgi:phospholipase/lecithinase/hemolysin